MRAYISARQMTFAYELTEGDAMASVLVAAHELLHSSNDSVVFAENRHDPRNEALRDAETLYRLAVDGGDAAYLDPAIDRYRSYASSNISDYRGWLGLARCLSQRNRKPLRNTLERLMEIDKCFKYIVASGFTKLASAEQNKIISSLLDWALAEYSRILIDTSYDDAEAFAFGKLEAGMALPDSCVARLNRDQREAYLRIYARAAERTSAIESNDPVRIAIAAQLNSLEREVDYRAAPRRPEATAPYRTPTTVSPYYAERRVPAEPDEYLDFAVTVQLDAIDDDDPVAYSF